MNDVVTATVLSIESELKRNEVYNVGTGVPTTVLDIVKYLMNGYNIGDANYEITGNFRLGDIRHNYADITRITKDLGFVPKIDIKSGIETFTNWVKIEGIGNSGDYQGSINELKSRGLFK